MVAFRPFRSPHHDEAASRLFLVLAVRSPRFRRGTPSSHVRPGLGNGGRPLASAAERNLMRSIMKQKKAGPLYKVGDRVATAQGEGRIVGVFPSGPHRKATYAVKFPRR